MKKTVLISTLMASVAFASNALAGGSCGDNCTWDLEDGVLTISGTGDMDDFMDGSKGKQNQPWNDQMDSITSVQVSNGITSIGDGAFYGATNLTSITIPEGVTSIGYLAFKDTSLTSITIPDTAALQVSPTGKGTFYNLDLSNVTIHCAGVLEQCKANMLAAGYEDGTYNMVQAPYSKKQADGSRAYYDANGKLTGFTGKRIYTVEEATKLSKDTSNTIKLRYK